MSTDVLLKLYREKRCQPPIDQTNDQVQQLLTQLRAHPNYQVVTLIEIRDAAIDSIEKSHGKEEANWFQQELESSQIDFRPRLSEYLSQPASKDSDSDDLRAITIQYVLSENVLSDNIRYLITRWPWTYSLVNSRTNSGPIVQTVDAFLQRMELEQLVLQTASAGGGAVQESAQVSGSHSQTTSFATTPAGKQPTSIMSGDNNPASDEDLQAVTNDGEQSTTDSSVADRSEPKGINLFDLLRPKKQEDENEEPVSMAVLVLMASLAYALISHVDPNSDDSDTQPQPKRRQVTAPSKADVWATVLAIAALFALDWESTEEPVKPAAAAMIPLQLFAEFSGQEQRQSDQSLSDVAVTDAPDLKPALFSPSSDNVAMEDRSDRPSSVLTDLQFSEVQAYAQIKQSQTPEAQKVDSQREVQAIEEKEPAMAGRSVSQARPQLSEAIPDAPVSNSTGFLPETNSPSVSAPGDPPVFALVDPPVPPTHSNPEVPNPSPTASFTPNNDPVESEPEPIIDPSIEPESEPEPEPESIIVAPPVEPELIIEPPVESDPEPSLEPEPESGPEPGPEPIAIEPPVGPDPEPSLEPEPIIVEPPVEPIPKPIEQHFEHVLDGSDGAQALEIEADMETVLVRNFQAVGEGSDPTDAVLAELDTLVFVNDTDENEDGGDCLTPRNLIMTQVENFAGIEDDADADGVLITFEAFPGEDAIALEVFLSGVQLYDIENLPGDRGIGNIAFQYETGDEANDDNADDDSADDDSAGDELEIQDAIDVFNNNDGWIGHPNNGVIDPAQWIQRDVFSPNTVTFLNDEDNLTYGTSHTDDVINAQAGDDIVDGLSGDDVLRGGAGNDSLIGGRGQDYLVGGTGDDSLEGGRNQDILIGGPGQDQFRLQWFPNPQVNAPDRILDFNADEDSLVIMGTIDRRAITIAIDQNQHTLVLNNGRAIAILENTALNQMEWQDDQLHLF